MNIAPTPEFLEAYRRATGNDDVSPRAVLAAIRTPPVMFEIRRVHAEIVQAKKSTETT
jgi:hypothetical protein